MGTFSAKVEGLDAVKKLFSDMENDLSAAQLRGILDEAGRVIIQEAKSENPMEGELRTLFNKDLGVYRDRRKSAKHAEYVLVGPRFKPYTIHGQQQKVAVIAQHVTEGFHQTDRGGHGVVSHQTPNPVLGAYQATKSEQNSGINKGVQKQIRKIKSKNSGVVK